MEIQDGAYENLASLTLCDDPEEAFKDADVAILVGGKPRKDGEERKDLLLANIGIFKAQAAALNKVASKDVKVLVVANPANTNCLALFQNCPDLKRENFTALT